MRNQKSIKPLVCFHADCTDGYAAAFAAHLKLGDEAGLLTEVAVPGKHIYTYSLRGKQQPTRLPYPKGHNGGGKRR